MSLRLKRMLSVVPLYESADGRWRVWREPYAPRRWFVNDTNCDETEIVEGFSTKRAAVAYLKELLGEQAV